MKFIIGFVCLIAAVSAGPPNHSPAHKPAASGFPAAEFPKALLTKYDTVKGNNANAFWDEYMKTNTVYKLKDAAAFVIAFFDSAAGEIDDIFPDASLKLAIYQTVSIFTLPAGPASVPIVTDAFATISAWGTNEAQAAATVDILLSLTNKVYHHYIDADNKFLEALEGKGDTLVTASEDSKHLAEIVIKFTLRHARSAVKTCYKAFREEIVEGTDAIILCEAFAYSTRGFPTEPAEKANDEKKVAFFKGIIGQVKKEAQADITQFVTEAITGIKGYKACIILEAIALDHGLESQVAAAKKLGVTLKVQSQQDPIGNFQLPTTQEIAASYVPTELNTKAAIWEDKTAIPDPYPVK